MVFQVGLSSILAQTSTATETLLTTDTASVLKVTGGLFALSLLVAIYYIIRAMKSSEDQSIESKTIELAAIFLLGLIIFFAEAMAMYYWGGNNSAGKEIFDACKTQIPPLVTLVIGFYFGRSQPQKENPKDRSRRM